MIKRPFRVPAPPVEPGQSSCSVITFTARAILVVTLWALCYPVIVIGLKYSPPFYFAAARALVAGIALVAAALLLRRPFPRTWRHWRILFWIGVTTTAFGFLGMFHAGAFLSPGIATVLSNTQPLLASLLAVLFGAGISKSEWLTLGIGFFGVAFVAGPSLLVADTDATRAGLAFLVASVAGIAVGNVLMKRIADEVDPLVAVGAQFLIGGLLLLTVAIFAEAVPAEVWNLRFISIVVVLAILGTAAPYWLWFRLLARGSLARANAFTFLTPVIGVAIGIVMFGERPSPWQALGFLLIIAALAKSRRSA